MFKFKSFLYFFLIIFLVLPQRATAQLRILTIPSTDTLKKKEIQLRDSTRFRPFNQGEYVLMTPSVNYGIGHDTDIYFGVPTAITSKITNLSKNVTTNNLNGTVEIYQGMKKAVNLTKTTRLAVGFQINESLQYSITPANFEYLMLSQKINITKTRLTAGFYLRNPVNNFMPSKPGAMLGFEQNIIPEKFILAVDWTSRNEPYGLLVPGFYYRHTPQFTIKSGVLIPNGKKAKLGFILLISKIL